MSLSHGRSLRVCARSLATVCRVAVRRGLGQQRLIHTASVCQAGRSSAKKVDRKLKELKKAVLPDYAGVELSDRQKVEWENIESVIRELEGSGRGAHHLGDDGALFTAGVDKDGNDTWAGLQLIETDTTEFEKVDFTHLTSAQIQTHAAQLRAGFVAVPQRGPVDILRFGTRQYFNIDLGTNKAARQKVQEAKVTLKFYVDDLQLAGNVRENLIALVDARYDSKTDEVQLTSSKFPSSKMNKEYLKMLLTRLVTEATKLG